MAKSDAIIRNLEHIIDEKEREIEMLKDNLGSATPMNDEKVKNLEKRVTEIEGLMKGLTEELLDLKAMVRKISKMQEGRIVKPAIKKISAEDSSAASGHISSHRTIREPPAHRNQIVTRRSSEARASHVRPPVAKPDLDPGEDGEKVLIMQPDGTLRPEIRKSERMIVAGKRSAPRKEKQPRRDERVERTQNSKPLIYAEEDDTVEIKDN